MLHIDNILFVFQSLINQSNHKIAKKDFPILSNTLCVNNINITYKNTSFQIIIILYKNCRIFDSFMLE